MPIPEADFAYLRALVEETTGIVLEWDKRYIVETRLIGLLRAEGVNHVRELIARLRAEPVSELHHRAIAAMANNETTFFRDIAMFEMLRCEVLPALIKARASIRQLTIWSAACSTGQEPYSLAMLLDQAFPELRDWDVALIASDFSSVSLDRARQGNYTQFDVNRGLPATMLVRYFTKSGEVWQVESALRERVRFEQRNLLSDPFPERALDLVLLRNVMIYWSTATKREVLRRVREALAPGGALVLGAAETTYMLDDEYEICVGEGASCYRARKADGLDRAVGAR